MINNILFGHILNQVIKVKHLALKRPSPLQKELFINTELSSDELLS